MEVRAERVRRELSILAEAFQRYDGDRSGALDKAEFVQALTDLNLPAGEFDIAALFNRLDADKSGTIELGEWLERLPRGTRLVIVERFEDEASSASVNAHRAVRLTVPSGKMIYTYTDEAPMLATYSLLPIIRAFTKSSKVTIQTRDISVAGRILASFPEHLTDKQQQADCLADLGNLAKTPVANIVKLPNVSASIPQLEAAISELQSQGFKVPSFPREPVTEEEKAVKARYSKVLGSAVNPVLREGNSDRRVAAPVKAYARAHPHRLKAWSSDSKTHVAHMTEGDFYGSEKSACMQKATSVRVELRHAVGGGTQVLKSRTALLTGEVIDAAVLSVASLRDFYEREMLDCKKHDVLFSLHLKATMMKISDPIMFGHAVTVYFRDAFQKHAALFQEIGVVPDNGLADVLAKVQFLSDAKKRDEVLADLSACYSERPSLAMVDSDNGITNLHVPSDVIIDASMPPMIRDGGKMWNKEDKLQDTKALVPDRCYAGIFQATVEDCQTNGAFNVTTMGNVANVGLMAQKAEEYGSHDKTFKMARSGTVRVVDIDSGDCFFEHEVAEGDIWRMCQTKDSPIQDWVRLAVSRARATGSPATFWLDEARAHDAVMIGKVRQYLQDHDTSNLDISILPPVEAMKATLARVRQGLDSISVTGNVLRDYLTDLFPILELGTSAKMLSVVPLLAGGGLYETGAGGSAPKHVQQFVKESHLRWDSLGEFLALAVSLQDLGSKTGNPRALILADTLNAAIGTLLENDKSPKRKVGQLDNRGSHYYLATYWAEALASQTSSGKLAAEFTQVAASLKQKEESIVQELMSAAGKPADLGGYYRPDVQKTESAMRPSTTFNRIIDSLGQAGNRVEVMGEAERRAVSSISAPI
eukprot:CAMPEP_0115150580 /NCGR_PEP_ID=MMETSP0227-20121206/65122_1 /TAXON_ID=89957 /ORGANISM="Polarella glacialis, Strain CCMP 1383" /LENGTH=873 /DNA_ID=CAMNT_0002560969 /DNA_START=229 /DNA_END=2850 /DNA_ORIENTATION=+